jgi:hypothetical protein
MTAGSKDPSPELRNPDYLAITFLGHGVRSSCDVLEDPARGPPGHVEIKFDGPRFDN